MGLLFVILRDIPGHKDSKGEPPQRGAQIIKVLDPESDCTKVDVVCVLCLDPVFQPTKGSFSQTEKTFASQQLSDLSLGRGISPDPLSKDRVVDFSSTGILEDPIHCDYVGDGGAVCRCDCSRS